MILGGPSILGALKILILTDSARSILLCLSLSVFSRLAEDEYSIEVSAAGRANQESRDGHTGFGV